MRLMILILVLLSFDVHSSPKTAGSSLEVTVKNAKSDEGILLVSVFDHADGFPDKYQDAIRKMKVKIHHGVATLTLKGLKPGQYAIAVAHDANNNGKLDKNGLGIPTEGIGFSNNAKIVTGPPQFDKAAVAVHGPKTSTQIDLKYF